MSVPRAVAWTNAGPARSKSAVARLATRVAPWEVATGAFVLWTALTTVEPVQVAGIGPRIILLALALALWLVARTGTAPPFSKLVLAVAIGVPVVWSMVATFYPHSYAGSTPSPTRMTIAHASHFVYLLIYFPLADMTMRGDGRRGTWLWIVPTCILCAITWAVYVGAIQVGLLKGVIALEANSGIEVGARAFFANHFLLIPAAAVLLGWLLRRDRSWAAIAAFALVLGSLYPIHTRGITLGVVAVLAVTAVLSRSVVPVALLGAVLALLLLTSVDTRTRAFLSGERSDASLQARFVQAPELLDAFEQRPLMGSGLGATLPSGYAASRTAPYSFELTYHQILFQNGVIGLMLILALPLYAAFTAARAMKRLGRNEQLLAVAGVAAIAGELVTAATNPYLVSGFGMLALAVALALCARASRVARYGVSGAIAGAGGARP